MVSKNLTFSSSFLFCFLDLFDLLANVLDFWGMESKIVFALLGTQLASLEELLL